ncbi:MAG: hypothetical protein PWP71_2451 [Clostridia bacterium]|nr:hypothetical protein [Clostridia bacterium]
MKQGKRLTRKHKLLLKKKGLNPDNWLVIKKLTHELHVVHRHTNRVRIIPCKDAV